MFPISNGMNIKKGDNVVVITGADSGKSAKVIRSIPKKEMVVVEGVNEKSKRVRPKKTGEKGQVIKIATPVHISNVRLADKKKK